jgi:LysM repeat protein
MSNENGEDNERRERAYHWWLRYVIVPVTLALIAGGFALTVALIVHVREKEQFEQEMELRRDEIEMSSTGAGQVALDPVATPPTPTPDVPTPSPTSAPPTSSPTPTSPPPTSPPPPPTASQPYVCGQVPSGWVSYVVRLGDTLYSLGRRTGTTEATIRQVNCLPDTLIYEGQQIWLPAAPLNVPGPEPPPESPPEVPPPGPPPNVPPPQKPDATPEVTILSPADEAQFICDEYESELCYVNLTLQGRATDLEDGILKDSALIWTTDRTDIHKDAVLGTGSSPNVRLGSDECFGVWHKITLTATDSDGNVGESAITIATNAFC